MNHPIQIRLLNQKQTCDILAGGVDVGQIFRTEFSILTINEIRLISGLPLYCSLRCQNAVGAIRVFFYAVGLSKTQKKPENRRYSCHKSGVEGLSGFSTDICPVVAVFCCPRAHGKRAWKRETVTVESCQQAQSTSITRWTTLQMLSLNDNFLNVVTTTFKKTLSDNVFLKDVV